MHYVYDLTIADLVNLKVQLLKQEFNAMNLYIRRVLESTQSNQLDFNVSIMYLFVLL